MCNSSELTSTSWVPPCCELTPARLSRLGPWAALAGPRPWERLAERGARGPSAPSAPACAPPRRARGVLFSHLSASNGILCYLFHSTLFFNFRHYQGYRLSFFFQPVYVRILVKVNPLPVYKSFPAFNFYFYSKTYCLYLFYHIIDYF